MSYTLQIGPGKRCFMCGQEYGEHLAACPTLMKNPQVELEAKAAAYDALQAENARLEQLVADFRTASMLEVGNQGGPCWVEPRHVEQHVNELRAENARLGTELERERIRLAACGVVALADTPESAIEARKMHDDYRSCSVESVARRVDECIKLRSELATILPVFENMREALASAISVIEKQFCHQEILRPLKDTLAAANAVIPKET